MTLGATSFDLRLPDGLETIQSVLYLKSWVEANFSPVYICILSLSVSGGLYTLSMKLHQLIYPFSIKSASLAIC